ncbi:MAG: L-threonylcarbamoyladenylate synthase [Bacteroidales bacterium]|jgi:L-threonylcarbamoyladenylate synthase
MFEEICNSVNVLAKGGIILYPTDTVWGLGCDATNPKAVERIFKIKKRKEDKRMIILVNDSDMLKEYVNNIPEIAWDLISKIDQPTTIIYPEARNLAENLISPDNSIAIRIVKDEFCDQMITLFGKPIVSTSANISGETTPLMFSNISEKIIKSVDYVVDLDHSKIKQLKPSTIIKLHDNGEYEVVRK